MTDFHDQLGGHLLAAATRRLRRRRAAAAIATTAAVVAAGAWGVVVAADQSGDPERDVAAPRPMTGDACPERRAPREVMERFGVLRPEAGYPSGLPDGDAFELDEVGVARVYGPDSRVVRYGSGLQVRVVPVMLGSCEAPGVLPGVCLVPVDERWPTACRGLEAREPGWPQAVVLRHSGRHGETQLAGIVSDDARGVLVSWPGGRLDVEGEGGRIEATVPHGDPSGVRVVPLARP